PNSIELLLAKLEALGVPTPPVPDVLTPQTAAALAGEISRRVDAYTKQSGRGREAFPALVLRALKQARYDPRNLGHSGLASRADPAPSRPAEPRLLPLHLADPPLPRPRRPPCVAGRARPGRGCTGRARGARRAHVGTRARGGADRVHGRRALPRLVARGALAR